MSDVSSTHEKGQRNETEAANLLGRVYGKSNVDKVHTFTNHDPLGIADVLGLRDGWPIRVVQVKTNSFTAEDRRKYRGKLRQFPHESAVFEVWVRVDYEGWQMYRYDESTGEFVKFLSMDTCDTEETVEKLREELDYYSKMEEE